MNKRQKKKKWDKIKINRYNRFCELTMRVSVQTDIILRRNDYEHLKKYVNGIKEEMENIRYDMKEK